jgi:hypothetical protein
MPSENEPSGNQPVFAFLSNTDTSAGVSIVNVVTLDEVEVDFELFQYLFYATPGKNFNIARSNIDYSLFNYSNFTLNGTPVSLLELFLSTYETVNSTNRNYLNPQTSISLVKQLNKVKNVVQVLPYLVSLSYDDLIDTLESSLVISPELNSIAEVTVILSTRIYAAAIDLTITVNIPVTTSIPGYASSFKELHLETAPVKKVPAVKLNKAYSLEEVDSQDVTELKIDSFKVDKILGLDSDISVEGGSEQGDNGSGSW